VVGSILLGAPDFVKENFLSGKRPDKDLPALRQLIPRISMPDIFHAVDSEFGNDPTLARVLKIHLCRQHTGEKLKAIGANFGISASAVSHACRRVTDRIRRNSKLRKKIEKMGKKLNRSRFNGLLPKPYACVSVVF
jgi:hypothetical protein